MARIALTVHPTDKSLNRAANREVYCPQKRIGRRLIPALFPIVHKSRALMRKNLKLSGEDKQANRTNR